MKPRADYFLEIADDLAMETIQGEAQKYAEDYKDLDDMQKANNVLLLYLQIAMDEGYRRVMEELKQDMITGNKVNIVPRKKGWFEYIEDHDEVREVGKLVKRRINSKRMRKRVEKDWTEQGKEWSEENYVLMVVIHTGWEHGYRKGYTMEHMAKITCGGDQERADMIVSIFNEVFTDEVMEKLDASQKSV